MIFKRNKTTQIQKETQRQFTYNGNTMKKQQTVRTRSKLIDTEAKTITFIEHSPSLVQTLQ